jgi:16S rRNA (guanine527-N7)-methyltransferase
MILQSTAATWGLELTPTQLDQFAHYGEELRRWNERVNLTAIRDPEQIVVRHFLDSLACATAWGHPPDSLIDIGSGAGFPGLPLKILRPELQLTLVESVAKKAAFLNHMAAELGFQVTVLTERAETLGRDPRHRAQYDLVTARAVAELRVLAEYCLPLCRLGGRMLAPKGGAVGDEVAAARHAITLLGGNRPVVLPVTLPGLDPRTIVVVEKRAATPAAYPRAVGVPAHKPIS